VLTFPALPASAPTSSSILLVEDQETDVNLIAAAFKRAGIKHPIVSVRGGLSAMAYLKGDAPYHDRSRYPLPALVLLDVRMPGVDGFEVLRWIRQQPTFARTPVVMLTGSDSISDAGSAYQLGATSFMVKPFDFSNALELSRSIERLIRGT
jgi:CheY-like chemotaxis protein